MNDFTNILLENAFWIHRVELKYLLVGRRHSGFDHHDHQISWPSSRIAHPNPILPTTQTARIPYSTSKSPSARSRPNISITVRNSDHIRRSFKQSRFHSRHCRTNRGTEILRTCMEKLCHQEAPANQSFAPIVWTL